MHIRLSVKCLGVFCLCRAPNQLWQIPTPLYSSLSLVEEFLEFSGAGFLLKLSSSFPLFLLGGYNIKDLEVSVVVTWCYTNKFELK